ncbi:MAG: helix-turn-helix domain-containing protein [Candidatus Aenigmarchaeota archaeon]|nr:helix-turn-helix domain-containing protein [Candidatus Aenigmarchaeota archaeon]
MKPFCEVMVKNIFPAIRALLAKELMENLNHTQNETAELMGVTQPAISQYCREMRGKKVAILKGNEAVFSLISDSASSLAKKGRQDNLGIMCSICREIRNQGLLCKLHKEIVPALKNCDICMIDGCGC